MKRSKRAFDWDAVYAKVNADAIARGEKPVSKAWFNAMMEELERMKPAFDFLAKT